MDEDLAWLKALIIEHGGAELVVAIERAAREENPPLDKRGELKLVLDELEAILSQSFKIIASTMHLLKAEYLILSEDTSSNERDGSVSSKVEPEGKSRLVFSQDSLFEWQQIAEESDAIIREMRQRYDIT